MDKKHLIYAASHRCMCGAGLAHRDTMGPSGYWDCSRVLLGEIHDEDDLHTEPLPFVFHEDIKSERESTHSTTRPKEARGIV